MKMNRLTEVLEEKGKNYILPFFWQHGEDEDVLRNYVNVIHDANIGAFCVESRPHPDFCGPKTKAMIPHRERVLLEIDDAYECAEVFVNGISSGTKVIIYNKEKVFANK